MHAVHACLIKKNYNVKKISIRSNSQFTSALYNEFVRGYVCLCECVTACVHTCVCVTSKKIVGTGPRRNYGHGAKEKIVRGHGAKQVLCVGSKKNNCARGRDQTSFMRGAKK